MTKYNENYQFSILIIFNYILIELVLYSKIVKHEYFVR
jgi:hypothetical protein